MRQSGGAESLFNARRRRVGAKQSRRKSGRHVCGQFGRIQSKSRTVAQRCHAKPYVIMSADYRHSINRCLEYSADTAGADKHLLRVHIRHIREHPDRLGFSAKAYHIAFRQSGQHIHNNYRASERPAFLAITRKGCRFATERRLTVEGFVYTEGIERLPTTYIFSRHRRRHSHKERRSGNREPDKKCSRRTSAATENDKNACRYKDGKHSIFKIRAASESHRRSQSTCRKRQGGQ